MTIPERQLHKILRRLAHEEIVPGARQRIQNQVLQEFARITPDLNVGSTLSSPRSYRVLPMVATSILALLVLGTITTAVAANASKPGDLLYPIDRTVENVRLVLTVGSEAKATYQATIVEERTQELQVLEDAKSTNAIKAEIELSDALGQAIETVTEVRQDEESHGLTQASETLKKVEERLQSIQNRRKNKSANHNANRNLNTNTTLNINVNTDSNASALSKVTVKVNGGKANITIIVDGKESVFTLNSPSTNQIVKEIKRRTGANEARIRALLQLKNSGIKLPWDQEEFLDEGGSQININSSSTSSDGHAHSEVHVDIKANSSNNVNYHFP